MASEDETAVHRCGYVAIVGRPNVGKSTLLNRIIGRKIAIVTPKPQTTRRRLLGIKTTDEAQILFVDTPGLHAARGMMNARMVEAAQRALVDADVALWVVDATMASTAQDQETAQRLAAAGKPVVVAANKIDAVQRIELLPFLDALSHQLPDADIVPVSAVTGENLPLLMDRIGAVLPTGPALYPEEEITDESERAIIAEIVREKVMLATRDEIPYAVAVTVESFEEKTDRDLVVIKATIHVERESQRPIVIGNQGQRLKSIGQEARAEIEELLGTRVFLELFVKVQPGWSRSPARLREFGL
jgi:GTP-binding protein Era